MRSEELISLALKFTKEAQRIKADFRKLGICHVFIVGFLRWFKIAKITQPVKSVKLTGDGSALLIKQSNFSLVSNQGYRRK